MVSMMDILSGAERLMVDVRQTGSCPVFRAEPHDTVRHLAEYLSLNAEMGFIHDHHDVMRVLRDVLSAMVDALAETAQPALRLLNLDPPEVPAGIPTVDFDSAQRMIEASTGRATIGEPDLSLADEQWLGDWARAEHGSDFVFVTGYPMSKRPFYTHPDSTNPAASNSLCRGLELVTGGQRLHRYEDYLDALQGHDLDLLEGYLEAFRHGMPAHGGFAIGLERWVASLAGVSNVR
jgi:nondiscriminating aspartyl-tRNA synthetase